MKQRTWMIYGAYGYSGNLIAEEAVRQGLTPILAGRDPEKTRALAEKLALEWVSFNMENQAGIAEHLAGMFLVLHCAGPFAYTAKPMIRACLQTGCHYLDITGEIEIFEFAHSMNDQAVADGITLCPGVGFDVIPTDCLAKALKEKLPDATHLALGFDSRSGFSKGTAKTAVEGLGSGGRIRKDGKLTKVPLAYKTRKIDFGNGEKWAMTIPWGDVATAYFSTEIPNIEVYLPASPRAITKMRRLRWLQPCLNWGWVKQLLKRQVEKKVKGPSEKVRAITEIYVWGEVKNAAGKTVIGKVKTANGYTVTQLGSLEIAKHLLKSETVSPGFTTPSRLMGTDFVSSLPNSSPISFS